MFAKQQASILPPRRRALAALCACLLAPLAASAAPGPAVLDAPAQPPAAPALPPRTTPGLDLPPLPPAAGKPAGKPAAKKKAAAGRPARPAYKAQIRVTAHRTAAGVTYVYRVVNRGGTPVIGFSLGYDFAGDKDELQGARPTLSAPNGWNGEVMTPMDGKGFQVVWSEGGVGAEIPARGSLGGFAVTVPRANAAWLRAHWLLYMPDSTLRPTGHVVRGR